MDHQSISSSVLEYIKDIWLLLVIAGSLTLFMAAKHIRLSYLQKTPWQVLLNLVWSVGLGMAVTVVALWLQEEWHPGSSAQAQAGVAALSGIAGTKILDWYLRKRFGMPPRDSLDLDFIVEQRDKMTPSQRAEHVAQCPFRKAGDCNGECDCPNKGTCGKDANG